MQETGHVSPPQHVLGTGSSRLAFARRGAALLGVAAGRDVHRQMRRFKIVTKI
jgi:hypothetical protein